MPKRSNRINWPEQIKKQRQSGLTIVEFCKSAGYSPWSFYFNRKRILRKNSPPLSDRIAFQPLGHIPQDRCGMRIFFFDGTKVECDSMLGIENLSRLLSTLSGRVPIAAEKC
jgi:hypothetical protein